MDNQFNFRWNPIKSLILAPIPGPTPPTRRLSPYGVGPGIGAKMSDLIGFELKVHCVNESIPTP